MIDEALRTAIRELADRQIAIRAIWRLVRVSRNTVRRVLRTNRRRREPTPMAADLQRLLQTLYPRCEGNVARMRQLLHEDYQRDIPYTTLARWVRDAGLRPTPRRVGTYHFGPGEEMQHDTSPMRVAIGGKPVATQCAALTLAYSRRLYMQFLPQFTRFEAKSFLSEALTFMGGSAPRCVIDTTSVIVVGGSGAEAIMAPEMVAFAEAFGMAFLAHRIQDPDRKARIERPFHYIQHNFLVARAFRDWDDLNEQARRWCETVANATIKRALGMTPEAAYLIERPLLRPLPVALPPIYQTLIRTVDSHGVVHLDTNRYSAPERFIGRRLTVLK